MSTITRTVCARIPTAAGQFQLCHYANEIDQEDHLALVMGDVADQEDVLVRVHSECFTGDVLGSMRCDCGEQLQRAMEMIAKEGRGVIIYLRQEGRGIGLEAKLQAYNLQDQGYDTVEANVLLGHQADEREYWAAAGILDDLSIKSIRLLTNNPTKIESLTALGVRVNKRIGLQPSINDENAFYLDTKVRRMRHMLALIDEEALAAVDTSGASDNFTILLERQAEDRQNTFAQHARPFVTLSYAQSIDGSIAQVRGEPLPISGAASLRLTHALRAAHDAILVGVDTVIADDPRLNVRLVEGSTPAAVILDSRLRTPPHARLFDHHDDVLIITTEEAAATAAAGQLANRGATILGVTSDASGRPQLVAALEALGQAGIQTVMVEGGAEIIRTFLDQGQANVAVITVAPIFLGGLAAYGGAVDGGHATPRRMINLAYDQFGNDLIIWGEFAAKPGEPEPASAVGSANASIHNAAGDSTAAAPLTP